MVNLYPNSITLIPKDTLINVTNSEENYGLLLTITKDDLANITNLYPKSITMIPKKLINNVSSINDSSLAHDDVLVNQEQILNTFDITETNDKTSLICDSCEGHFANKFCLNRHTKYNCKGKKNLIGTRQIHVDSEKVTEDMPIVNVSDSSIINSNVNSNNTITNVTNSNNIANNNIIMVNFGEENMENISLKDLLAIYRRGYNAVPALVELVHFKLENSGCNNVFVSDVKSKYGHIFRNGHFEKINKKALLDALYETKKNFIMGKMDLVLKHLNDKEQKPFQRWKNSDKNKFENEKEKKDAVYEDLLLILYNKRHIPLETKKLYEQQQNL
jgi:hypothetical protein